MRQQPLWMCNNANCPFRNRLLADAKLTTPHFCPRPAPIPVFVNPFPSSKPIIMLPPPPLGPAPPGSFYFPPPNLPLPTPPTSFPLPGPAFPQLPSAPMPPGPFMLPPPQIPPPAMPAFPLPQQQAQQAEQKQSPPDPPKSPSIGSVVHENSVHTFKPRKGPISKEDKEALSDFEKRTRRQEYRDLAESSKHSQHKSEAAPTKKAPSIPRSILKNSQSRMPAAVNQEVHVKVYNTGHGSKEGPKTSKANSSQSAKSMPAKDAASIREEAIKRAHILAHSIAAAAAPATTMSGAVKPPSEAGSHPASKAPSYASKAERTKRAPSHTPSKNSSQAGTLNPKTLEPAPSNAPSKHSKAGTNKPVAPLNAPSKHASQASHAKSNSHKSKVSRATSQRQSPVAVAAAIPPSIESWRESVQRPIAGA